MTITNTYPSDFTSQEQELLIATEIALAKGLDLKRWYQATLANDSWSNRFEESLVYRRAANSFGFFDEAPVGNANIPVMGNFQSMFYDQPKSLPGQQETSDDWIRDQMREFILKYFMRISDFREPEGVVGADPPNPPACSRPLSWCPKNDPTRIGFGFSQLFYKLKESGEIGRFPAASKNAIVDLREIGSKYEWIVVYVDIFDFSFALKPFKGNTPSLQLPLTTGSYLVINKDFITHDENPANGLGSYGFGYSFIRNPGNHVLNYGPGEFEVAFETIDFNVLEDGKVRVDMAFASNRPNQILNVPLDPLVWGKGFADLFPKVLSNPFMGAMNSLVESSPLRGVTFDPLFTAIDMTNLATLGSASSELCISKETLFRAFLLKHFEQHYQTIVGSLQTWRQIPDWLNQRDLPAWVITGASA